MRNKLFIAVFCLLLLVIMIGAPGKKILTNAGLVTNANVGNVIEVEKVYEEGTFGASLFNSLEEIKRDITDIYTNYIPFYVGITTVSSTFQQNLNQPVTTLLMNKGNAILAEKRNAESAKPSQNAAETTASAETDELSGNETPDIVTTEEVTTAEPAFVPESKAIYLQGDRRHRYYEITSTTPEGQENIDFYVRIPAEDADKLRPTMEEQVRRFNIMNATEGINFYTFAVTCFEDTVLCDELLPAESKHELFDDFFAGLDDGVQYAYLDVNTFEDKWEKYWATDHHWNYNGYKEAHEKIASMFKENYPDIEIKEPETLMFDGCKMFGSNALAVSNYKIWDNFGVTLFQLPEHSLEIESNVGYGGTEAIADSLSRYQNKKWNTSDSYNHYIQFFRIARQIQYPGNNTGRNLLLISDSYSPPLMEVLASYFDTTIIRYVDSNSGLRKCSLAWLVENYGITDVLVLEMSDRVIYDYYGDSLNNLLGF